MDKERALHEITNKLDIQSTISKPTRVGARLTGGRKNKEELEEAQRVTSGPVDPGSGINLFFFLPKLVPMPQEVEQVRNHEPRPPNRVELISQIPETQIPNSVVRPSTSDRDGAVLVGKAMET